MRPCLLALLLLAASTGSGAEERLRVVATTTDLGSLATTIGADEIDLATLVKGPQDPHRIEPRPSFIQKLHRADALLVQGLELEIGWVPPLLQSARNPRIQPGAPGYVDASGVVRALEVPGAAATRATGDVHRYGNPHYLTDPVNGVRVAALLARRFGELRPGSADAFQSRYEAFARAALERLVGAERAAGHDPEAALAALESGGVEALPGTAPLAGWLGTLARARGTLAVEDHQYWIYFANRFGIELVARLEPYPGIAPTTRHLGEVVDLIETRDIRLILASTYFDPRHARRVAGQTGALVVELAHQVGARDGTQDYLATIDHNVRAVRDALDAPR